MLISELVAKLQALPQDYTVILADDDGNYFSPLADIETGVHDEDDESIDLDPDRSADDNAVVLWARG